MRMNFPRSALVSAAITLAAAFAFGAPGAAQDRASNGASSVEVSDEGKELYEQICQACHMADAKGGGEPAQ